MENSLPTGPLVAARSLPIYPTLSESWAVLGWYLLSALMVGGGTYLLLRATGLPAAYRTIATTTVTNVALIAFLRWKAGSRWPHWRLLGQARPWHFAVLPLVVVANLQVRSLTEFARLTSNMTPVFEELRQHIGVTMLYGIVIAPLLEELLFRGILLNGLLRAYAPWVAIAQSALLFGLIHFNPPQCLSAGLLGLLLGWLYYRTRSLGLCIALHVLNNGLGFAGIYLLPDAWQHADTLAAMYPSPAHYAAAVGLSGVLLGAFGYGVRQSTTVEIVTEVV